MNAAMRLASAAGQQPARRFSLPWFTRRTDARGGFTSARTVVVRFGAEEFFTVFM